MAIEINSMEILDTYFKGVMNRAEHHSQEIKAVCLALLGAVIWKSTGELEARQYSGSSANIIWFWLGDRRFVFCYEHNGKKIQLRERTYEGEVIKEFNDKSTCKEIYSFFESLGN